MQGRWLPRLKNNPDRCNGCKSLPMAILSCQLRNKVVAARFIQEPCLLYDLCFHFSLSLQLNPNFSRYLEEHSLNYKFFIRETLIVFRGIFVFITLWYLEVFFVITYKSNFHSMYFPKTGLLNVDAAKLNW